MARTGFADGGRRHRSSDLTCTKKFKQFLARISNHKVSGLSEHNRAQNHVELKGPDEDDPVIHFDISWSGDLKDRNLRFR